MRLFVVATLALAIAFVGGILAFADLEPTGVSPAISNDDSSGLVKQVAVSERSVTLRVDGMFCPSCPYIVRRALEKSPGVLKASVSLRDMTAVVTYDAATTDVAALIEATTGIGYPSRVDQE